MNRSPINTTPEGWVRLDHHSYASDHHCITGVPIRSRHADAFAVANMSICASRRHPVEVVVVVGSDALPGWRVKDGLAAAQRRAEVREDAALHLGVDARCIRIQARYSRLAPVGDGMIIDRNTGGYYVA